MKLNRKGFAITGILYTILILFLLLLSSLLAILSTRINRLVTLTNDISDVIIYNNTLTNVSDFVNISKGYYLTKYRGKYEFTINDGEKICYSYLPNNTLLKIENGKIKYKVFPNDSQCVINIENIAGFENLEIFNCENADVNSISFNNASVAQVKELVSDKQVPSKLDITDLLKEETPDFANVATTDEGVYKTEDDLGASYYFRGASTKNYVYFADYYWRIIRINGDGSIRMIYDGKIGHENGVETNASVTRQIGTSAYGGYSYNAFLGYMYGKNASGSYYHGTSINSGVKNTIDNWYQENLSGTIYEEFITDAIYCNDRSIYEGTGGGYSATIYNAYNRLINYKTPSLKCNQNNDRFSQSTTIGNGALTYPVGLITADEIAFAGGVFNKTNTSYYLYTGQNYWTMSPTLVMRAPDEYIVYSFPYAFYNSNTGKLDYDGDGIYVNDGVNHITNNSSLGIRPVISLNKNTLFKGSGTIDDPFEPVEVSDNIPTYDFCE